MTVSNTSSRGDYTENGVTTQFPIPFYFLDDTHVLVIGAPSGGTPAVLVLGSDYTVAGAGVAGGGTLTILTPTNGRVLTILRDVPFTQLTHYVENDPFPAASHERALDLLTMQNQQQQEALNRAAVLPSSTTPPGATPTPVEGSVLGWASGAWAWLSGASVSLAANLLTAARGYGADLVRYLAPYTGAVGRLLYLKLSDHVCVLDFGADPTGVASSSAAFHAALATGRRVYAPAGTYMASLSLNTNDMIYGDGPRRTVLIPPAGATSVILIDASTADAHTGYFARQCITLSDFSIKNPNNVANCAGIWFKGTGVNNINDQHSITNMEIGPVGWETSSYAFAKGVKVTGRLITLTAINLMCSRNTIGWHSSTDSSTPAFNGNTFINCVFQECVQQGFLHTGQSTNVNFLEGYTQGNNTANAAGVAGCDISDIFNWTFDGHGFEGNGSGTTVNTTTPMGNSISLLVQGTICQNLTIKGGYFTASGANVVLGPTLTNVVGGVIENNYLNCLSGGFNFANLAQMNSNYSGTPLVLGQNNLNGKVSVYSAGIGQQVVARQSNAIGYLTTAQPLDLLQVATIVTNPSVTLDITSVANMIPGCELVVMNIFGTAGVTIAAALMQGGALATVASGTIGRFKVLGAPFPGLFYRMS